MNVMWVFARNHVKNANRIRLSIEKANGHDKKPDGLECGDNKNKFWSFAVRHMG